MKRATLDLGLKHATSTAGYTVNEMSGSAREIVLDIVSELGRRNDGGGIYKLTNFTLGYSTRKSTTEWMTIPGVGYYELGFLECFCKTSNLFLSFR